MPMDFPSLSPSYVPMSGASIDEQELVWSLIVRHAMDIESKHHNFPLEVNRVRLRMCLVCKLFYVGHSLQQTFIKKQLIFLINRGLLVHLFMPLPSYYVTMVSRDSLSNWQKNRLSFHFSILCISNIGLANRTTMRPSAPFRRYFH